MISYLPHDFTLLKKGTGSYDIKYNIKMLFK